MGKTFPHLRTVYGGASHGATYFAEHGHYAATRMNASECISAILIEIGNWNCKRKVKQVYAAMNLL
jgi:hypothetical protein